MSLIPTSKPMSTSDESERQLLPYLSDQFTLEEKTEIVYKQSEIAFLKSVFENREYFNLSNTQLVHLIQNYTQFSPSLTQSFLHSNALQAIALPPMELTETERNVRIALTPFEQTIEIPSTKSQGAIKKKKSFFHRVLSDTTEDVIRKYGGLPPKPESVSSDEPTQRYLPPGTTFKQQNVYIRNIANQETETYRQNLNDKEIEYTELVGDVKRLQDTLVNRNQEIAKLQREIVKLEKEKNQGINNIGAANQLKASADQKITEFRMKLKTTVDERDRVQLDKQALLAEKESLLAENASRLEENNSLKQSVEILKIRYQSIEKESKTSTEAREQIENEIQDRIQQIREIESSKFHNLSRESKLEKEMAIIKERSIFEEKLREIEREKDSVITQLEALNKLTEQEEQLLKKRLEAQRIDITEKTKEIAFLKLEVDRTVNNIEKSLARNEELRDTRIELHDLTREFEVSKIEKSNLKKEVTFLNEQLKNHPDLKFKPELKYAAQNSHSRSPIDDRYNNYFQHQNIEPPEDPTDRFRPIRTIHSTLQPFTNTVAPDHSVMLLGKDAIHLVLEITGDSNISLSKWIDSVNTAFRMCDTAHHGYLLALIKNTKIKNRAYDAIANVTTATRDQLIEELTNRLNPQKTSSALMDELRRTMHRHGTIQDFNAKFRKIVTEYYTSKRAELLKRRIDERSLEIMMNFDDETISNIYVQGLKFETKIAVLAEHPITLSRAEALAIANENAQLETRTRLSINGRYFEQHDRPSNSRPNSFRENSSRSNNSFRENDFRPTRLINKNPITINNLNEKTEQPFEDEVDYQILGQEIELDRLSAIRYPDKLCSFCSKIEHDESFCFKKKRSQNQSQHHPFRKGPHNKRPSQVIEKAQVHLTTTSEADGTDKETDNPNNEFQPLPVSY